MYYTTSIIYIYIFIYIYIYIYSLTKAALPILLIKLIILICGLIFFIFPVTQPAKRKMLYLTCEQKFVKYMTLFTLLIPLWYCMTSQVSNPPRCIMQPAATFVNYVHIIKITQKFRQFSTPLTVIFSYVVREPTHNNGHDPLP